MTSTRDPHRHPRLDAGPDAEHPRRRRPDRRPPVATTELVLIRTEGDVNTGPLAQLGGTGVFVGALREALLRGEIDLAVHSLKDLPTAAPEGITLAAVPLREDPRDVVVARDGLTLGELPEGSRVGTGAPRRVAQLQALGLGIELVGVRGNVDTRMRKVADGELDAVVLARAGLARLGRVDEATEVLDPLQVLPAPGQGALAVECRAGSDLAGRGARRPRRRRPPVPASRPSAPCSPSSRPAARHPWAHWPKLRKATTVTNCGYVQSRSRPTAPCPYDAPRADPSTTPSAPARSWPPRCSPRAPQT